MQIGIIGAGRIGGTLARRFADAGHDVAVSNSRGPDTLRDLEAELGERGRVVTAADAARFGDVVVVSVPLKAIGDLPAGELAGKLVVDTNNYYPQRDGHVEELDEDRTTSTELLARRLDGARVVKAFNAIRWDVLRDRGAPAGSPDRLAIPISGDDPAAKRAVTELIDSIGFDAVDAGGLADGGRKHQPGTPAYGVELHAGELRERLHG